MKRRPIRVAHLLIALVVIAVLIEGLGVGPRWRRYYRRARQESRQAGEYFAAARRFEAEADGLRRLASRVPGRPAPADLARKIVDAEYQADGFRQLGEWSEATGDNYRRALIRPWAVAGPDPSFRRRSPAPGSMPATSPRP